MLEVAIVVTIHLRTIPLVIIMTVVTRNMAGAITTQDLIMERAIVEEEGAILVATGTQEIVIVIITVADVVVRGVIALADPGLVPLNIDAAVVVAIAGRGPVVLITVANALVIQSVLLVRTIPRQGMVSPSLL